MSEVKDFGGVENETSNMEIPKATSKEIIFTDYIRDAFDKVATAEGFKNFNIKIDHGSTLGDGYVGTILKVKIQELNCNKLLSVIAKIPPQSKATREMMNSMKLFDREVFIYNEFFPELMKFQEENNITKSMGFYDIPKVYFADCNYEKDEAIIIMEDLREKDYKMCSKYESMDFEHIKLVISSLGKLHGLSFAIKIKKPELFEKFKEIDEIFYKTSSKDENFNKYMEASVLKAIETLEDPDKKQKAIKILNNFKEEMLQCVEGKYAEPFAVINHGDCWINNLLFNYNKEVLEGLILIDWQMSLYCSPIFDLVYFIFHSTDQEFRDKHWDKLLKIYHESLREIVEHVGGDITVIFPKNVLLRHLKKFSKFVIAMTAFNIPMILTKNEELVDMDFMADKIKDQDSKTMVGMMGQFDAQTSSVKIRLQGIMEDALKYEFI